MGAVTDKDQIMRALESVIDPELHRSIVELDMVRSIELNANGVVDVTVSLTTPGCPIKGHFQSSVVEAVSPLEGVSHVNVYFDVLSDTQKAALQQKLGRGSLPAGALAQVANVICVGSGKGGVGKSTLTANLAAALAAEGTRVGVLDADVWGYSIPRMYGLGATRPDVSAQRMIIPLEASGVKVMSIGFFVEEDAAVVWRGPMLHKALTQFLQDVDWGALDYLLVDLPPGTGDVSMTLAQLLPQARFLIVTTPQATAQRVARRAAQMANKVELRSPAWSRTCRASRPPPGSALRSSARAAGGARRRAGRAPAGQGAAHDGVARTRRQRAPARDRGPRRALRPGDPPGRPRADRGGSAEAVALPLVEVPSAPPQQGERKPVGMSLPMA